MKSWKYEKDTSTGEVYAVYHSVPIFKEHTGSDGTEYTQELLQHIADNNNDRIEETGDYCPIVGWHTPSDNDPSKDPPIIGFAENFRVEKFGKKSPKWCIYATFKIRKDKHGYFRDHPRRSVEIWPEDKPENRYIDPIAVLGAETPRQDLGLVYSKSAAGEESYMYSSVAGGGNTYVPGEVERSAKGEINPEGLQEDHPSRLKPSGYDRQHAEILSSLFPAAGQEPVLKGEKVAVRRFLNTAQEELKPHYDLFGVTNPKRQKITSQTIHKVKKSGVPDYSRNSGNHGVVTLNDVSFNVNQKLLAGIVRGGSKTPMASGVGSYAHSDPVDVSSDEYDEVDFNPKRGHLFALVSDSKTNDKLKAGHAIAGADEATFINNRVFVKNARPVTKAGDPGHEDGVEFMTEDGKTASSHPHGKESSSSKYDKPGPKDPRRTPAPKKDQIKGSDKNPKGSASKTNTKIEISDKTEDSLKKKMQEHNKKGKGSNATLGALKSVYRRGAGAYSSSHHPKMSRHGWAMARVNAFLTLLRTGKPSNSNYKQDNDLLPKGHPKKSKNSKKHAGMIESLQKYAKEMGMLSHEELGGEGYTHAHKWGYRPKVEQSQKYAEAGRRAFNEPHAATAEIARKYIEANRDLIGDTHAPRQISKLDPSISKRIAAEYISGKHDPSDPKVMRAYQAMADESAKQMQALIDAGYKVEMYPEGAEPYANSQELIDDLNQNKHLWIFPTEDGFGEEPISDEERKVNPLLQDSGFKDVNGKPMLLNDAFRAVHDFFGHSELGNAFGPVGEENAWQLHSRMFSPEARRAMTTETRGQNSWVNFGPHIVREDGSVPKRSDPDFKPLKDRPFADQKNFLLPDDTVFGTDDHEGEPLEKMRKKGPRVFKLPPKSRPKMSKEGRYAKYEETEDGPGLDSLLNGGTDMALDQQSVTQIIEGLKPTIIDIVQEELPKMLGYDEASDEMIDDMDQEEMPEEEPEDELQEEPEDEVLREEPGDEDEDEVERNAKCEYGKEMFAKMAEKHNLYGKDADHKGASQYMASMDESDRNAMGMYMKSDMPSKEEKDAYAKCNECEKNMKENYSKASEGSEADKFRKQLEDQADKFSKLQQQYSKLQSELIEAKDQLTEARRSEKYHKIADRLSLLEAEGYVFDKEQELEFCMQLNDELREEHLNDRIPSKYTKSPSGQVVPVEKSEVITPVEQKSVKYSKSAQQATIALRSQGAKGVDYKSVLNWMIENDTEVCPTVEDLK